MFFLIPKSKAATLKRRSGFVRREQLGRRGRRSDSRRVTAARSLLEIVAAPTRTPSASSPPERGPLRSCCARTAPRSTSSSWSDDVGRERARIAPRSRRCRVSRRVSTSEIPEMSWRLR